MLSSSKRQQISELTCRKQVNANRAMVFAICTRQKPKLIVADNAEVAEARPATLPKVRSPSGDLCPETGPEGYAGTS